MLLEVQLVPKCCTPRGMQRVKIVEALAPSRTMAGPRTLTITARRIGVRQWECWFLPWRFWWRREPDFPRMEQRLFWRDSGFESVYQFVRQTEVVCDGSNPGPRDLGPDVRLIAADTMPYTSEETAACTWRYIRRVFFLDAANELDGFQDHATKDSSCVLPRGHRSRCNEVNEQSLEHARKQCRAYNAETEALAKGWLKNSVGVWVSPEQFAAEQRAAREQAAFERRARAG